MARLSKSITVKVEPLRYWRLRSEVLRRKQTGRKTSLDSLVNELLERAGADRLELVAPYDVLTADDSE